MSKKAKESKKRKSKKPLLEAKQVLQVEAERIKMAARTAKIIHQTVDIDSAGSEIETTVRDILRKRLPLAYHVSQGHVVDTDWNASGQFDIIIADNFYFPILFQTLDGTEYFAHESVYAIGEVKATFTKASQISDFVKKCEFVRKLRRAHPTPLNYLNHNTRLDNSFQIMSGWPYRNPLFTFMLFVDSGKFDLKKLGLELEDLYSTTPAENLPNVVCFLNLGALTYHIFEKRDKTSLTFGSLEPIPEFTNPFKVGHWLLLPYGGEEQYRESGNLAAFYSLLFNALANTVLSNPDYFKYLFPVAHPAPIELKETYPFIRSLKQAANSILSQHSNPNEAVEQMPEPIIFYFVEEWLKSEHGIQIKEIYDTLIQKKEYSSQEAKKVMGKNIALLHITSAQQNRSPSFEETLDNLKKLTVE